MTAVTDHQLAHWLLPTLKHRYREDDLPSLAAVHVEQEKGWLTAVCTQKHTILAASLQLEAGVEGTVTIPADTEVMTRLQQALHQALRRNDPREADVSLWADGMVLKVNGKTYELPADPTLVFPKWKLVFTAVNEPAKGIRSPETDFVLDAEYVALFAGIDPKHALHMVQRGAKIRPFQITPAQPDAWGVRYRGLLMPIRTDDTWAI